MFRKAILYVVATLFFTGIPAQEPDKRDLSPFSRLVVGDKVQVRLVKSDRESAVIKVQGIDAKSVVTEVSGNTLKIGVYGASFTRKKVTVTLNYVQLGSIEVNGGADVSTTSLFIADSFVADLKSGGMLYLDADIGILTAKITEGAILNAEGYATEQDIVVATSGTFSAFSLEGERIRVRASSGGKAKINVEKELDAEVSSNGFVSYKGNPPVVRPKVSSGGILSVYEP